MKRMKIIFMDIHLLHLNALKLLRTASHRFFRARARLRARARFCTYLKDGHGHAIGRGHEKTLTLHTKIFSILQAHRR